MYLNLYIFSRRMQYKIMVRLATRVFDWVIGSSPIMTAADDLRYLQQRVQNLEWRADKAERESAEQKANRESWYLSFWFGLWSVSLGGGYPHIVHAGYLGRGALVPPSAMALRG